MIGHGVDFIKTNGRYALNDNGIIISGTAETMLDNEL